MEEIIYKYDIGDIFELGENKFEIYGMEKVDPNSDQAERGDYYNVFIDGKELPTIVQEAVLDYMVMTWTNVKGENGENITLEKQPKTEEEAVFSILLMIDYKDMTEEQVNRFELLKIELGWKQ